MTNALSVHPRKPAIMGLIIIAPPAQATILAHDRSLVERGVVSDFSSRACQTATIAQVASTATWSSSSEFTPPTLILSYRTGHDLRSYTKNVSSGSPTIWVRDCAGFWVIQKPAQSSEVNLQASTSNSQPHPGARLAQYGHHGASQCLSPNHHQMSTSLDSYTVKNSPYPLSFSSTHA